MNRDAKLCLYAVGALAATAWAGADQADAGIVSSPGFAINPDTTTGIDLNQDGTTDFSIQHISSSTRVELIKNGPSFSGNNHVTPAAGDTRPAALTFGAAIDSSRNFSDSSPTAIADGITPANSLFSIDNVLGNTEYVGVSFNSASGAPTPLYGWIGIDITNATDVTGNVTGFAYEDSGNGITAGAVPEPAGLALLALGAPFLLKRRNGA